MVSQPVFNPHIDGQSHSGTLQPSLPASAGPVHSPPPVGDYPFRIYMPTQQPGFANMNNDMLNLPGLLSQEGRHFQWQLSPGLPAQPPAPTQQPVPIQPAPVQPPVPQQQTKTILVILLIKFILNFQTSFGPPKGDIGLS